jgi:hypothetical protein
MAGRPAQVESAVRALVVERVEQAARPGMRARTAQVAQAA